MSESLPDRIKRLKEEREAKGGSKLRVVRDSTSGGAAKKVDFEFPEGDVPVLDDNKPKFEGDIDSIIDGIGIIEAYKRWIPGQTIEDPRGRTESIMCQCPRPEHSDKHPSAWVNTNSDTWFCGGCQEGGDKLDLAAYYYDIQDYKNGRNFHDLRRAIAGEFGMAFYKDISGKWAVVEPDQPSPSPVSKPELPTPEAAASPVHEPSPLETPPAVEPPKMEYATVTPIDPTEDPETEVYPGLDWRSIVQPQTFLYDFMEACRHDDVPEEYHFWHGMLAIGMALGKDVGLFDSRTVFGNLFICILGRSGSGKSRSKAYLDDIIFRTMPFDEGNPATRGVRRIQTPASAEALIGSFIHHVDDPSPAPGVKNPPQLKLGGVRGLVDYNEMSSLLGRTARQGNVLAPTLMQFYDAETEISIVSRTYGTENAKDSYASVTTTSQPAALGTMLDQSDADSGFLNRWMFVTGTEKKRVAIGGAVIDVEPCVEPMRRIIGWAAVPRVIQWSDEAAERFTEFYHSHIEPAKKSDEDSILTRADLMMKKLVLLFTANAMEQEVTLDCVERAIMCWDYLLGCYKLMSSKIGDSASNQMAHEILRQIRAYQLKNNKGMSLRDIVRATARKKWDRKMLEQTIQTLIRLEQISKLPPEKAGPGRPTDRYGVSA